MKFSVIIPLYNCASYVEECIESILNNDYDINDIQIIVVNDGSTDNSLEIVSKYKDKIEIYTKVNGNWGSVINYVKDNVKLTGDYITILDSDDKLTLNCFDLISKCDKCDIIIANYYKWMNKKKWVIKPINTKSKKITDIDICRTFWCHPHGKFYKKELFLKLDELQEKKYFLDGVVYHSLLNKSKDVFFLRQPVAFWRSERPGNSTMMEWDDNKTSDFKNFIEIISMNNSYTAAISLTSNIHFKKAMKKRYWKLKLSNNNDNFKWYPFGTRNIVKLFLNIMIYKIIEKEH